MIMVYGEEWEKIIHEEEGLLESSVALALELRLISNTRPAFAVG